jgi:alpha-tubulin suppressor-like RCC1 family protein
MPVVTTVTGVQYSGIWTMQQVNAAIAAGTWPVIGPTLFTWGSGSGGALALNNTTNYSSPKQVGSLKNWSKIVMGSATGIAIKTDGTLWGWGSNYWGNLGLGTNSNYYSSPKQIGTLTTWYSVDIGAEGFTVAIKTDGTLWAWGNNTKGQLGLNNLTKYSSPKQVGSLTNWAQIHCAYNGVMAVKTDGTLWGWGNNSTGQIGLGNTTNYSSPKQVGSLTNWLYVASNYSTIATKTDGTMWSWGYNASGQLGRGNTIGTSSPQQLGALTNWSANIGINSASAFAIKSDGTAWSWGGNTAGELGLGNQTNYSSPKQIGALNNWSKISPTSGGNVGCFSIKTDGTLWGWGSNSSGRIGLGNTTNYSSPKQVGNLTSWLAVSAGYTSSSAGIASSG